MGAAAHADGPGLPPGTSGELHGLAPQDGANDWSELTRLLEEKAAKEAQAAAPQSPVEAPAAVQGDVPGAAAPAGAPVAATNAAPAAAVKQLPATGGGARRSGGLVLLAATLVAVAGVACVGGSRLARG